MAAPAYRATMSICPDCGSTYYNLWAHLEECSGKTVRQAEPLCGAGEGHWPSRCGLPAGHHGPHSIELGASRAPRAETEGAGGPADDGAAVSGGTDGPAPSGTLTEAAW